MTTKTTMQANTHTKEHSITIEELDRIACAESGLAMELPINSDAIAYLTAIRDAVVAACRPQLRPIAEMPAEVPDGCVRRFWCQHEDTWGETALRMRIATHYIDIVLPEPVYPPEFEQAWGQHGKLEPKAAAFALWKGGER